MPHFPEFPWHLKSALPTRTPTFQPMEEHFMFKPKQTKTCDHFSEVNVLRLWLAEETMGTRSVGKGYLFKGAWLNLTKYSSDEGSSLGADHWVPWLPLNSVDKTQRMHSYGPCILATPCSGRTGVKGSQPNQVNGFRLSRVPALVI